MGAAAVERFSLLVKIKGGKHRIKKFRGTCIIPWKRKKKGTKGVRFRPSHCRGYLCKKNYRNISQKKSQDGPEEKGNRAAREKRFIDLVRHTCKSLQEAAPLISQKRGRGGGERREGNAPGS